MKMENYANVRIDVEKDIVIGLTYENDNSNNTEESNYYVALLGNVYGHCIFDDGTLVQTSAIKEASEGIVRTHSGSVYNIGVKDPDYAKFGEAVETGIPILENCSIGLLSEGVYIKGNIKGEDTIIMKKVVSQDGAILTLYDGSKVFVDWIAIDPIQESCIMSIGMNTGTVKCRVFCGIALEPDIFNSEWKFVATARPLTDELAKRINVI